VTVLTGGRVNSLPEFTRLAGDNGLRVVAARSQPPGFVVECVPA
jgi:hypothetical protein